ncbi:NADP-dependent oxidoreductase [Demequina lutea]|uniref:NADPH:quinone reductase-like Zn-dependent oxidoreductase n=1 Tax=Demequina lutea TaxID=431489 RepID=A0A7Y9Z8Z1_9MICO|nr:NADP-dependent oxidoreductase [Demequina lutea]NYI40984.1 NADPH:quinone reductase-like Zn-dependent oxidoreductase [Demequina lutea]
MATVRLMETAQQRARAVRFDRYGDRSVLYVADVPMPIPADGEVLVSIRAAAINPGETSIRTGALHERFPATFPSGEGTDLAGVVTEVGADVVDFAVGDEVLGFSWTRSSHATHAAVPASQLILKPDSLDWETAGSLAVAGCAAYAAVRAVGAQAGETVAVSAAAGGVGGIVVQLLAAKGVRVLGIASSSNDKWLSDHGAIAVNYGERLGERLLARAPQGVDAFIDLFGPEYVELAAAIGVPPARIETIIAFEKARELGAKAEGGASASTREVLGELASLVTAGQLRIDIAATYPLDDVADAFAELEQRHTRGKIVLLPSLPAPSSQGTQ